MQPVRTKSYVDLKRTDFIDHLEVAIGIRIFRIVKDDASPDIVVVKVDEVVLLVAIEFENAERRLFPGETVFAHRIADSPLAHHGGAEIPHSQFVPNALNAAIERDVVTVRSSRRPSLQNFLSIQLVRIGRGYQPDLQTITERYAEVVKREQHQFIQR